MFAYVYPPNEPAAIAEWVGRELGALGMAVPVLSHPGNPEEVVGLCQQAEAVVFHGGLTQLSWLFDTPEKVSAWLLSVRKPRVALSTELVFIEPPQHGTFRRRCHEALRVMTHIVGMNDCAAVDFENQRLRQTGLPVFVMPAVPFAFSGYPVPADWSGRRDRFCFLGTNHGIQRQVFLRALARDKLVDVLEIPKSDPQGAVTAFNRHKGILSLRGNHGVPVPFMPRLMEGAACGCYVLDLQHLDAFQVDAAVEAVRGMDWNAAEQLRFSQLESVLPFAPRPYFTKILNWLALNPYAG